MTEKEQIAELLKNLPQVNHAEAAVHGLDYVFNCAADYLISHGVTITPAILGPEIADPNIMELCFRNGERHMKEKVLTKLKDFSAEVMFEERISGEVTVVNFEYVIRMLEDL